MLRMMLSGTIDGTMSISAMFTLRPPRPKGRILLK
jgi:hypothetical protein